MSLESRLLQLPIEHEGRAAGYLKLQRDAEDHAYVSLIINEVSMVSSLNMAYIHLHLDDIFAQDVWFGGVNVLFVGNMQLLPVSGTGVFATDQLQTSSVA